MAEINAIEIANSSLESLEREPTNEIEVDETTPLIPKLALSNVDLPNGDDDRIETAASKESNCSPENQLKVFASALNGNSFISSKLIDLVCIKIY